MVTMPYPIATHYRQSTPNISRECESGSEGRLALETSVLDGRAIGRWRVRPLAGFPDGYASTRVPYKKKPGKWPGMLFGTAGGALAFSVWLSQSPPALKVTGDLH
jgi:hypothetical protein